MQVHYIAPGTLTPAERALPPRSVARICLNGHLAADALPPSVARRVPLNRADPLSVATSGPSCATCGAGAIVGCPGCGYPIPGRVPGLAYAVPHFCVVCGEYYPWTFRGEFYATLEEILVEAPRMVSDAAALAAALRRLGRLREGLASFEEIAALTDTLRLLGGSDWDLAAQVLRVVLPAHATHRLDLSARFSH